MVIYLIFRQIEHVGDVPCHVIGGYCRWMICFVICPIIADDAKEPRVPGATSIPCIITCCVTIEGICIYVIFLRACNEIDALMIIMN